MHVTPSRLSIFNVPVFAVRCKGSRRKMVALSRHLPLPARAAIYIVGGSL